MFPSPKKCESVRIARDVRLGENPKIHKKNQMCFTPQGRCIVQENNIFFLHFQYGDYTYYSNQLHDINEVFHMRDASNILFINK
ncbi:hypothetical protein FKM82_028379 [Ascaphus truei]